METCSEKLVVYNNSLLILINECRVRSLMTKEVMHMKRRRRGILTPSIKMTLVMTIIDLDDLGSTIKEEKDVET